MTVAQPHVTTSLPSISVHSPYDGSLVGTVDITDAKKLATFSRLRGVALPFHGHCRGIFERASLKVRLK